MDKYSVRQFCTQESSNLFRCDLCRKTYTHISNFCRHFLSSHHGIRQEVPCPVCTRMFTRRDNMLTHMKQVHRVSVPKVYATNNNSSSRFEYNSLWYFNIVHACWHTAIQFFFTCWLFNWPVLKVIMADNILISILYNIILYQS